MANHQRERFYLVGKISHDSICECNGAREDALAGIHSEIEAFFVDSRRRGACPREEPVLTKVGAGK